MAIPHPATRVHLLTLTALCPSLVSGERGTGAAQKGNSFYVAAIVKPLFPFFPSLASFLEELYHIVLISLYTCILVLRKTGMAMRVSTSQSRDDPYPHP